MQVLIEIYNTTSTRHPNTTVEWVKSIQKKTSQNLEHSVTLSSKQLFSTDAHFLCSIIFAKHIKR